MMGKRMIFIATFFLFLSSSRLLADTQVFGNQFDEVKGKNAEMTFEVDFSDLFVLEAGIAEEEPIEGNIEDAKPVTGISLDTNVENGVITASKTIYPFWRIKSNDSYTLYLSSHTDTGGALKGDVHGENIDWHALWQGEYSGDLGKGGNYFGSVIHSHAISTLMDEDYATVEITVPAESDASSKQPDMYRTTIILSNVPDGGNL